MKDTDFIYIPGWAINHLNLKGNELMIYSIIYSYSRDGINWYQAPQDYLATCIGASVSTVKECLKKLAEKGLINKKAEVYKGSVNRVYYQAVVDQYENGTGKTERPVPFRYGCTSTETVLNNTTKDISIKQPSTASSGKRSLLKNDSFVSEKSEKSKKDKVEKFVLDCHHISDEFEFDAKVSDKLVDFFRMLGQQGTFLPEITIRAQLEELYRFNTEQQKTIISETIRSGWKSLRYAAEKASKQDTPSFDTSKPGSFQPKDPKNDRRAEQYKDDEVF
jgi:hypothetical protein